MMKKTICILSVLFLVGCGTTAEELLQQLNLEEDETGSVCVRAMVDLDPSVFGSANATVVYKEFNGVDEPDC